MRKNTIWEKDEESLKDYLEDNTHLEPLDTVKDERALWRAVITQALMDAGSNSTKREMRLIQAQAASWLSGMSPDFAEVCALAGWEPEYVRSKAKLAIRRGCWWREYNANSFRRAKGAKARRWMSSRHKRIALKPEKPVAKDAAMGCVIVWPKKRVR